MRFSNSRGAIAREDQSFFQALKEIFLTKGVFPLYLLNSCISFGIGIYAIAPAVASDSFARYYHGYTGPSCFQTTSFEELPPACSLGSIDAQTVASWASFIQYGLMFFTSPLWGTLSDRYGRKGFYLAGATLNTLGPTVLLLIQVFPTINPTWYYAANAAPGMLSLMGINLAIMSDIIKPHQRVLAFSLCHIFTFLAIPVIPTLAAIFGYLNSTILATVICLIGLILIPFILPESLSPEDKQKAIEKMEEEYENGATFFSTVCRPIKEFGILNRSNLLRYTAVILVLAEMVKGGERSIFLYFIQGQLGFDASDIATYTVIHSISAFFVNTYILKKSVQIFGERNVLIVCMVLGIVFNVMYGIAHRKIMIYVGVVFSAVMSMFLNIIVSIMANNVQSYEKGKIQGVAAALFSLSCAIGPLFLNSIFDQTVDGDTLGPRTMFFFSAFLFVIATSFSYALSPEEANTMVKAAPDESEETLLNGETSENVA